MQLNHQKLPHLNAKYGWRLLGILAFTMLLSLLLFLGSIAAYFFFFHDRTSVHSLWLYSLLSEPSTIAFQLLLTYLALLFAPLVLIWKFGFQAKELFRGGKTKFLNYLIALMLVLAASILIDQLLFLIIGGRSENSNVGNYFTKLSLPGKEFELDDSSFVSSQLLLFLTLILGPILEETVFRNILWKAFRSDYSFLQSSIITSFFFALIHFEPIQGLSSFFIGFVYSFIVEKTRSVYPCIVAHISASYLTFFMSQSGLKYGVGGESYPLSYLIPSICVGLFCLFYFVKLSNNIKHFTNSETVQKSI